MNKIKLQITNFKLQIIAIFLLQFAIYNLYAGRPSVGTSGAVFLKMGSGARAIGMAEAVSAIADDANTLFYNPAGLGTLEKIQLGAMYGQHFQDLSYHSIVFAVPVHIHQKNYGTFGFGLSNLSVPNIEKRTGDTEAAAGTFSAKDFSYNFAYSKAFLKEDRLSLGLNMKYVHQSIDTYRAGAFAVDFGVLVKTPFWFNLSGVIQNFGTKTQFTGRTAQDRLPLNFKLGVGVFPFKDKLKIGLDGNFPRDNRPYIAGGVELTSKLTGNLSGSIRAGYRSGGEKGSFSGASLGAGLGFRNFRFDFAWVPYRDLGNAFRYSLLVKF